MRVCDDDRYPFKADQQAPNLAWQDYISDTVKLVLGEYSPDKWVVRVPPHSTALQLIIRVSESNLQEQIIRLCPGLHSVFLWHCNRVSLYWFVSFYNINFNVILQIFIEILLKSFNYKLTDSRDMPQINPGHWPNIKYIYLHVFDVLSSGLCCEELRDWFFFTTRLELSRRVSLL